MAAHIALRCSHRKDGQSVLGIGEACWMPRWRMIHSKNSLCLSEKVPLIMTRWGKQARWNFTGMVKASTGQAKTFPLFGARTKGADLTVRHSAGDMLFLMASKASLAEGLSSGGLSRQSSISSAMLTGHSSGTCRHATAMSVVAS